MPDLNELLRWSIANSTAPDPAQSAQNEQLALRFNPTTNPSAGSSALHPSDPLYRTSQTDDAVSPASTPGPATPVEGTGSLPGLGGNRRSDLTTEMLDLIMGKSDSVVMKEKMEIASDESRPVDERVEALDDFEMLIELIDNANNMAVLKLWEPLLRLMKSPEQPIVAHACWIAGTAVQNNLKAQAALYIFNLFPVLLDIIYPSSSQSATTATRSKATYAFGSALKHWPLAASVLSTDSSKGYSVLKQGVSDNEQVVKRKMAFLVGTLVMQSAEKYTGEIPTEVENLVTEHTKVSGQAELSLLEGLKREGVLSALLKSLKDTNGPELDFEENAMRTLGRAAKDGGLSDQEKSELRSIWEQWGEEGRKERDLIGEDAQEISRSLA